MPDITIKSHDGDKFMAYIALPKKTPAPGIVLIQEIFGVNKVMRDLADDWAERGFVVVCPDIFWRQEPGIVLTDQTPAEWEHAFKLYQGFDRDLGVKDLISTLVHLRQMPECTGKVATMGFCLGGFLAFKMATSSDADANVSYYGVAIEQHLDEVGSVKNPLLMHMAAEDKFVSKEAQAKIGAAIANNPRIALYVYEGNNHAFARVGGEHYDAKAATLAHNRTMAFLEKMAGG